MTESASSSALEWVRRLEIMDVGYQHYALSNGDDLYLTVHGRRHSAQLMPENFWSDKQWFLANNHRLSGTSMVYKIRTRPAEGKSLEIVLKWNRMGQDVPGATLTQSLDDAEFNSPFEEFSLLQELRNARLEGDSPALYTHKPLAIYVPKGHVEPSRLGRKAYKMDRLATTHEEIELDLNRNYAVIYEWIKGLDAAQACEKGLLSRAEMEELLELAQREMARKGYLVRDHKVQHVIVRPRGDGLLRRRDGACQYAVIDFELLARTETREQAVRDRKRKRYLLKQAHRFEEPASVPSHLQRVNILDVDYVHGHIESTNGMLWVVGKDPELFEYFLPEKWRKTPRVRLSLANRIYQTTTKDNIHLVWKVSRVGEQPDMDPFKPDEKRILDYGFNSPFEEIALNLKLGRQGLLTTYPRAIYMAGASTETPEYLTDPRRYQSHEHLLAMDAKSILRRDHDYMIIWGYWNGPDELLAVQDRQYYEGINALQAYRQGWIDQDVYFRLMDQMRIRLGALGVEDLNLRGNHILLSIDAENRKLVTEPGGLPVMRLCNFELLGEIEPDA
jgi:hypothetical protein